MSLDDDLYQLQNWYPKYYKRQRARLLKTRLLSPASTNAKLAKNSQFSHYASYILYLAPYNLSGVNLCAHASKGCAAACLNTAGRGRFDSIQKSRLRRALWFRYLRKDFLYKLDLEILKAESLALKQSKKAVFRLNGTSDLPWHRLLDFGSYPNSQFYDYTKSLAQVIAAETISNYHVTFSLSESNIDRASFALSKGVNVAVVFRSKIPLTYLKRPVILGDDHDLRFLDKTSDQGLIVGLTAKGKAKKDDTGFVIG